MRVRVENSLPWSRCANCGDDNELGVIVWWDPREHDVLCDSCYGVIDVGPAAPASGAEMAARIAARELEMDSLATVRYLRPGASFR